MVLKNIVGLELAYKTTNYGAQLQAYATQQVVERLGFTTKVFDLNEKMSLASHTLGPGFIYSIILNKKKRKARIKERVNIPNAKYQENRDYRKAASKQFIDTRLKNVTYYSSYEALVEDAKSMKAVIIGSDQKWTPGFCYRKVSSLDFAPKGVRRISYATSLGVSEYPYYCRYLSRKMWKKIDFLSVREQQGAKIIKDICGNIPVEVVVDPTYLLSREEWEERIPVKKMTESPYIFCYFLGNNDESKRCAKSFAKKNNLLLVSIMSDESFSPYDQEYADVLVKGAHPEDFVNWIRGAEYVFTDSFHGTAFSVINERQFFVFYRMRSNAKFNRNSRIDNILTLWNISDRLLSDSIDWDSCEYKEIDYKIVNQLVAKERKRSLAFLTKALDFDENK